MQASPRRRLIRIVGCLFLGLVSTVAVAWWGASLPPPFSGKEVPLSARWPFRPPAEWPRPQTRVRYWSIFRTVEIGREFSYVPLPRGSLNTEELVDHRVFVRSYGLPLRAMTNVDVVRSVGTTPSFTDVGLLWQGLAPKWLGQQNLPSRRHLPLMPVWWGFLGDTLFFAAAWYFLFSVLLLIPGRIRSAVRRRYNHCPACGYDRHSIPASAPCPECGRAKPS
jgi:hypothetical protein